MNFTCWTKKSFSYALWFQIKKIWTFISIFTICHESFWKWLYFVASTIISKFAKFQIFWIVRFGSTSSGSGKLDKNWHFNSLFQNQIARWWNKIFRSGFWLLIYHLLKFILRLKPFKKVFVLAFLPWKMWKNLQKITLKCPANSGKAKFQAVFDIFRKL